MSAKSTPRSRKETSVLGIDISKRHLDATLMQGEERVYVRVENTASGIKGLQKWLESQRVKGVHVCMEATNVYWEAVAEALYRAGYEVSVVNPMRIKGFAMSQMQRNKTDKLDSEVIAAYCAAMAPASWEPPSATQRKLRSLERHRLDLKQVIQQQKNRQESARDADVQGSLQRVIDALETELKGVEKQLEAVTEQSQTLREQKALLLTIPGIGVKTSHLLLAEMNDLAQYENARTVAADAGVTPSHHESGTTVRKRPKLSKVGKGTVRGELYMPALNAMRTNPILRAFAERLKERNKPMKVIICAVMRKLLHIVYGVLKHKTPFDPHYGSLISTA